MELFRGMTLTQFCSHPYKKRFRWRAYTYWFFVYHVWSNWTGNIAFFMTGDNRSRCRKNPSANNKINPQIIGIDADIII